MKCLSLYLVKTMANEFDGFAKKVRASMEEIRRSSNMQKIGEAAKDIIKKRTRLGYGVEATGEERVALKPLSREGDPSYVDYRKNLGATKKAKFKASQLKAGENVKLSKKDKKRASSNSSVRLSDATSPTKSNLTLTGQMLDSLTARASEGSVSIKASGSRNDGKTNEDVAGYAEDGGRRFLDLAKGDLNQLRVLLSNIVDDILKKLK